MAQKWNLQDIVPPDRGKKAGSSRERVTTPSGRTPRGEMRQPSTPPVYETPRSFPRGAAQQQPPYDEVDAVVEGLEITDGRLSRLRRFIFVGIGIVLLGVIGFTATVLLSGAEVTITPKIHKTSIQATYTAKLKPDAGDLGYEILTLEETQEKQIAATGQEDAAIKATGKILISNEYSATPQRLIQNTRFESSNGLIYRISDAVVIPGYTKDAAGSIVAGTVAASVVADGTGESYNIVDGRLSVPGLKGSEQYSKIYASVDTSAISGGFEGKKFIIDETELATTKQKLQTELRDKLLSRIQTERPNDFVFFKDAITFTYDSLPASGGANNVAIIKERAMLHVPLFNEGSFASFLAKETVASYKGEPVRIEDYGSLKFAYQSSAELQDISRLESLTFTLFGPALIIWKFDKSALKKDLAGKPEAALLTTLQKYPAIDKGQAVIRPVWKRVFPANLSEIQVTEVVPTQ